MESFESVSDKIGGSIKEQIQWCKTISNVQDIADLMRFRLTFKDYLKEFGNEVIDKDWHIDRIESEFKDAEKYFKEWKSTGLEDFRDWSEDELAHAKGIISISNLSPDVKAKYTKRIQDMMSELKKV